jgi:DNA-directed RNA polymerase delta subunit
MWVMSEKLSEEKRKQIQLDPEFIVDIEKKWSMRERALVKKVNEMNKSMGEKDRMLTSMLNPRHSTLENVFLKTS